MVGGDGGREVWGAGLERKTIGGLRDGWGNGEWGLGAQRESEGE